MISGNDEATLYLIFQIFDHNNSGYLDVTDLLSLFLFMNHVSMMVLSKKKQNIILTKKEIKKIVTNIFMSVDVNNDGKMSFDEYKALMFKRDVHQFLIDHQFDKKNENVNVSNE